MDTARPYCLSIAGFDPSGGAGLMADTKVFENMQLNGLGVVTALTYQNDSEFRDVKWTGLGTIKKQLLPLQKYPVKAAKIGLMENFKQIIATIEIVKQLFPGIYLVWDPILNASAGFNFHSNTSLANELMNQIDLITPNYDEYKQIGNTNATCDILLKGGHRNDKKGTDVLIRNQKQTEIPGKLFGNKCNKHGTGCVLSAAITANMAKGLTILKSCIKAKHYVETFMQSNPTKLGYHIVK